MTAPEVRRGSVSLPEQRDGSADALPAASPQRTGSAAPAAADRGGATPTDPVTDTDGDTTVLLVRAWGSEIAIGLSQVSRVAQLPAIAPVPGDRPSRVGVVSFEERTIPVDDLGMLLGIPPAGRYTLNHTLVVLESSGERVAVVVEPDVELLGGVRPAELNALPVDHPAPLSHVLSRDTRHIPVLDVERIVAVRESPV